MRKCKVCGKTEEKVNIYDDNLCLNCWGNEFARRSNEKENKLRKKEEE